MAPAARLDVPSYLDATRGVLQSEDLYISAYLDLDRDLQPSLDQAVVPSLGLTNQRLVFPVAAPSSPRRYPGDSKPLSAIGSYRSPSRLDCSS
jgi:hypothetical protein